MMEGKMKTVYGIGNPLIDAVLRSLQRDVAVYDARVRVHGSGLEIGVPVLADEPPQPFAAVDQEDLRPQIHESVGRRRAC